MPDPRLLFILAVLGAPVLAPDSLRAFDAAAGSAEVQLVDGPVHPGRVVSLDGEHVVLDSSSGGELKFPWSNVLSIRFSPDSVDARAPRSWLLFPNGDRASLEVLRIEDESLVCRWRSYPAWQPFHVPLQTAAALIVAPPRSPDAMRDLVRELSRGPFDSDVLILRNSDHLSGELQSISPEHYELNTPVGPVQAPTPQVQAVAFDSSLVSFPESPEGTTLAVLTDGSWLTLVDARLDAADVLSGETVFGEPVAVPIPALQSLTLCGPRVCFVSALSPAASQTEPYLSPGGAGAPYMNRNVRGGFLALSGREFPRGLGMTSASRTTYALNGEYQSFQATVGIDDQVDGSGSVVFAVEVDGRRLFTSGLVTGRDPPADVGPLDVRGARELKLIVDYGEFGDIQDVADWGNALLLRAEE